MNRRWVRPTLAGPILAIASGLGCGDVLTEPILANTSTVADAPTGPDTSTVSDTSTAPDISTGPDSSTPPDTSMGQPTAGQLLALVQAHPCTMSNMVSQHIYANTGSAVTNVSVCSLNGAIYFYSGMTIDCDGMAAAGCPGSDPAYLPETAFQNANGMSLPAGITPYLVLPRDLNYPGLDTVHGGNVAAVIYNNQVAYAVFGDTGPSGDIGAASYACAANLGINPDPATGGVDRGVNYIVFVGTGTAPADIEDQAATVALGQELAAALIANN